MRFNKMEQIALRVLDSFPRLKAHIKFIYTLGFSHFIRPSKQYYSKSKVFTFPTQNHTFFGYYDVSPENCRGYVLLMEFAGKATRLPTPNDVAKLKVINRTTNDILYETETSSFNWQQGCRAQWLGNTKFIFNQRDETGRSHCAVLVDINDPQAVQHFNLPVQSAHKDEFFLSLDYRRLAVSQPEYGYHDLMPERYSKLNDNSLDGVSRVCLASGKKELLVSIARVLDGGDKVNNGSLHHLNHCLISPSGKCVLFIHRFFINSKRVDSLLIYDIETDHLTRLVSNSMVSHYTWVDDDTAICFLKVGRQPPGYFLINTKSGQLKKIQNIDLESLGDGHPTAIRQKLITDTYPGKDRFQHLVCFDLKSGKIDLLGSFYSPIQYLGEGRCDLHPRVSTNKKRIYFDSAHSGQRQLCYMSAPKIP